MSKSVNTDIASMLIRASFEVSPGATSVTASRPRKVPSRGLFRLFVPRFVCVVNTENDPPTSYVRPDGLAIFMAIVCFGNVVVELVMDRVTYPREMPPAFVFGISSAYFLLLGIEWRMSRAALDRALAPA